jgi:hypothetical protein
LKGRGAFILKGLEANEEFFISQKNGVLNHTGLKTRPLALW